MFDTYPVLNESWRLNISKRLFSNILIFIFSMLTIIKVI